VSLVFFEFLAEKRRRRGVAKTVGNRGRDPSPAPLRLMTAPDRDTLSPRERAVLSH
jgi:hypothetical protein